MFGVRLVSVSLLTMLALAPAFGQQLPTASPAPTSAGGPPSSPQDAAGSDIYGGYMIGTGDILDIRVADEETLTGRYQVDQDGSVQMPLLSGSLHAAGSTTFQFAQQLRDELKKQKIMREPSVTVFIARGMSQNVTVLGAVARPGIYTLEQPTTLLDLLSRAGGVQPNAGKELVVAHRPAGGNGATAAAEQSTTIDLPTLMAGKNPSTNVLAKAGDVITVSTAPVVFVVGAVMRPGAFTVQGSKSEMTVLQAVAMAEGTQPTASLGSAVIVRQSADDATRQQIPIDLGRIFKSKEKDQVLLANDILFIPQSGFKMGIRRIGDAAVQAASQVTGYGLGVRVGRY